MQYVFKTVAIMFLGFITAFLKDLNIDMISILAVILTVVIFKLIKLIILLNNKNDELNESKK